MSNIIPPLVSSSPPPMVIGSADDLDEDEFGDFTAAELSFEGYSLPTTPHHDPHKNFIFCTQENPTDHTLEPNIKESSSQQDLHLAELANTTSPFQNIHEIKCDITVNIDIDKHVNNDVSSANSLSTAVSSSPIINVPKDDNIVSGTKSEDSIEKAIEISEIMCNDEDESDLCETKEEIVECSNNTDYNIPIIKSPDVDASLYCTKESKTSEDNESCQSDSGEIDVTKQHENENIDIRNNFEIQNIECFESDSKNITINETLCFSDKPLHEEFNIVSDSTEISESDHSEFEFHSNCVAPDEIMESNFGINDDERRICADEYENVDNMKTPDDLEYDDFKMCETNCDSPSVKCDTKDLYIPNIPQIDSTNVQSEILSDDDFGDFESNFSPKESEVQSANKENTHEVNENVSVVSESTNDFEIKINFTKNNIFEEAETILKNMFTYSDVMYAHFFNINFTENTVFKNIENIEMTNALTYQWSNSISQQMLMKALNIDTQNILYGPRWNASMPRFAANLGFTPLEPMKSELQLSVPAVQSVSQVEQPQSEVPAAKFDWTSFGLTNPLDYAPANTMLLDPEQFAPSFEIPSLPSSLDDNSPLYMESWNDWLKCQSSDAPSSIEKPNCPGSSSDLPILPIELSTLGTDLSLQNTFGVLPQSDNESVKSLKFSDSITEHEIKSDVDCQLDKTADDEFSEIKTESEKNWPLKLPLRETYITSNAEEAIIANKSSDNHILYTDSFPIENSLSNDNIPCMNEVTEKDMDDEFTDFQMSLPQTSEKSMTNMAENVSIALEPLKPIIMGVSTACNAPVMINWPEPGIVNDDIDKFDIKFNATVKEENKPEERQHQVTEVKEEDDWSDFVSAKDNTANKSKIQSSFPSAYNFNLDMFSSNLAFNKDNPLKSTNLNGLNQNNFDQNLQLQLSIPNLQSTQLKHKAVPSIFSSSSNLSKLNENLPPSTQQIAVQQLTHDYKPPFQIEIPAQLSFNPTVIQQTELGSYLSSQEAKKSTDFTLYPLSNSPAYNMNTKINTPKVESKYDPHNTNSEIQTISQSPSHTMKASRYVDEDDWSEYVSSPAQVNLTNCTNSTDKQYSQSKPNWFGDIQPNIIMNPVHFDSFSSFQSGPSAEVKDKNMHASQLKTKNISSMSAVPELEFVAPKHNFFSKK